MALRTTESGLVVFLCSLAAMLATKCVQKSQVTVSPIAEKNVTLTCNASCTLNNTSQITHIWYRNGQRLDKPTSRQYFVGSYRSNSYSCAVKGREDLYSPAVCVLGMKCFNVIYTNSSICALQGSTVDLPCNYRYPNNHTVLDRSWYVQEKPDGALIILSSVPEYEGRVEYLGNKKTDCTLRIRDLRESDSAEYKFRFKTLYAVWGNSLPGSTLSVTGLQVEVTPDTMEQNTSNLTCSTTCKLNDYSTLNYTWYKNGQQLDKPTSFQHSIKVSNTDSYSCAVSGVHSPAVCVLGQSCMAVTYFHQSICALKGSSINISCSFKYPSWHVVKNITWFKRWETGAIKNVSQDPEYAGRVEYHQTTDKDSTLRITDLRLADSAEYKFRFKTNATSWGYSYPGTTLTVTDLKVNPATKDGKVILSCSTSCTLTDKPSYIWYKNGQRLTNINNALYLGPVIEDAGYSCAVTGLDDLRSPEETLTDRSFPFPWFPVVVGGAVLTAAALSLTIYCTLRRRCKAGSGTTAETQSVHSDTNNGDRRTALNMMAMTPVENTLASVHPDSNSDTYTTLTMRNMSLDNGTVATVLPDHNIDTYTALNMRTRSADYDTLENVRDSHNETDYQRNTDPSDYEKLD